MEVDMQLLAPLIGIQLLLMVIALIDLVRRDAGRVAGGKKWPWALGIIFINTLGPIVYFFVGRKD
ncbi:MULTISPECIES: PLD nuclease N-terminal domain-containing protein [Brevibacillus]|jgi:hypothetical protein|uniref:Cardiolipin synthase N-terminal domain-containing protein n=1 Tax=Brevibacillus parabrevis TaxID=54914 RepID=A0A4Y3PQH9_BREPA|nr:MULTISPECIES: PLD nuclease N-terminal domain-containing protein [Brevibacillus]TGV24463.1 PLDc_N domain-containing protein [Mesorhizobium sp. M00.F.Ca.ET.186.01.1.1]KZE44087.1 hypothetical protein AV540_01945 [Brevibacillus parabrevis]MBU8712493.1 PLD nuclease N-terminal domain-containing protein [Brevibacillus parabrevis]MDH6349570.1 hypothetical protein [Brevibacillus sp. 1238]MDR5002405.1 PLD nuclease N-terminal domain-containing protein [Brevibacillus parabrevis]